MAAAPLTLCVVKPPGLSESLVNDLGRFYYHRMTERNINFHFKLKLDETTLPPVWIPHSKGTYHYRGFFKICPSELTAEKMRPRLLSLFGTGDLVDGKEKFSDFYYALYAQWQGLPYVFAIRDSIYKVRSESADASDASGDAHKPDQIVVHVQHFEENGTRVKEFFNGNFIAMLAAVAAYVQGFGGEEWAIDGRVNVLKEVMPFIAEHMGSGTRFAVIVDEIVGANFNVKEEIVDSVQRRSLVNTLSRLLRESFYCRPSYTTGEESPNCKLADSVLVPPRDRLDHFNLCFKRLEFYPVYEPYGGSSDETLIVGAGPTGLYTACLMAHLELPFTLIERRQRWQSWKGSESWTFLSRTQSIFLNTRWWEEEGRTNEGTDDTDVWRRGYQFVDVKAGSKVHAAKMAVIKELGKYTLRMTGTPFAHRAHTAEDLGPNKVVPSGFRCMQIWEAQEALLRLLMKTNKTGRIWFNTSLTDSNSANAVLTRNGVQHDFKCKRIVSCTGATTRDRSVNFINDAEEDTSLSYVTITDPVDIKRKYTTKAAEVISVVFQPPFYEKEGFMGASSQKSGHKNEPPGDPLTNIRFFPEVGGGIGYVAYVCPRETLLMAVGPTLAQKIISGQWNKKKGHASLETEESDAIQAFFEAERYTSNINISVKAAIKRCRVITWNPGLELQRRSKSAYGEDGRVVFLGDACAQPNFFTGTGFASGWSMADSFAMALLDRSFDRHNERVEAFVGKPTEEYQSFLYRPSNTLFLAWHRQKTEDENAFGLYGKAYRAAAKTVTEEGGKYLIWKEDKFVQQDDLPDYTIAKSPYYRLYVSIDPPRIKEGAEIVLKHFRKESALAENIQIANIRVHNHLNPPSDESSKQVEVHFALPPVSPLFKFVLSGTQTELRKYKILADRNGFDGSVNPIQETAVTARLTSVLGPARFGYTRTPDSGRDPLADLKY